MQPNFKRTQRGNPNQLVIDQHIHAAHCIRKFLDKEGKVSVFDKSISKVVLRKPNASIFCAKRAWDERAEKGYMSDIESDFFHVIDNINIPIGDRDHDAITRYFNLWRLRGQARDAKRNDIQLNGVSGSGLTIEEQEVVEKKHSLFIDDGGIFPYHMANGLSIQVNLDRLSLLMKGVKWGLLTADKGEFLVADYYRDVDGELCPFIPVSPRHVFFVNSPDLIVDVIKVRDINRMSISYSSKYYFCRSFQTCPS